MAESEDFLAHFGIKGMKWGVHHEVGTDGRVTSKTSGFSKNQKIAIGVGVGAAVAVGVAATALALKTNGKLPVGIFKSRTNPPGIPNATIIRYKQGNKIVGEVLDTFGTKKISDKPIEPSSWNKNIHLTADEVKKMWNDKNHKWDL